MERGSYVAASAGLAQLRKLEIVNNNLANVNTPGFKGQVLVGDQRTFDQTLASKLALNDPFAKGDQERAPEVVNLQAITDFTQGPIKDTGNPLDVALRNKNDFFVINTPEGIQYTRAGNFTLSEDGSLVTLDGMQVQGDGGQITVNRGTGRISSNGTVTANGEQAGRIQVVRIDDLTKLERVGGARFKLLAGATPPEQQDNADLAPASLEMSNVSAISSMLNLIAANRGFDLYTRAARTIDELDSTAINRVGRRT